MKKCPFCAEEIQDAAIKCRYCGEFLDSANPATAGDRYGQPGPSMRGSGGGMNLRTFQAGFWGYEYKSKRTVMGLPLLHVAKGLDPETGRPLVAKGFIAVGNLALGVIAVGGLALGGLAFGGVSLGLFALGGVAIGGVAFGGAAFALFLAVGGLAVSANYAIGGMAIAPHALGSNRVDPEFLQQLKKWWPNIDVLFRHRG